MGWCSPGARAVDVQSAFNVGSGFGFGGGAAVQGNSSVNGKYLVSNLVNKWVIAFNRLASLSPSRSVSFIQPPIIRHGGPSLRTWLAAHLGLELGNHLWQLRWITHQETRACLEGGGLLLGGLGLQESRQGGPSAFPCP